MKLLVNTARIIVGLLFMFSGFVKMVDPIGFSYKLQEYFGPGVFNLEFLVPYALIIAIILVIFEFLLGVMLILGYARKFTKWALLLMIIFFTFLTFYSAYFNKVTDCGCFGDAIPLTPWQSFGKDIILLLLIIFIFTKSRLIAPLFRVTASKWIVFVIFVGCLALSYQVLMHLPVIDFRPYKVGDNLEEGMISTTDELPPVHDFALFQNGEDRTDELLNEDKLMFVASFDLDKSEKDGWKAVKTASDQAIEQGYEVIGLTASSQKKIDAIKNKYDLNFQFIQMDETTVKTIVRSNPGLLTLHKGTVTQKVHWNDVDDLVFE